MTRICYGRSKVRYVVVRSEVSFDTRHLSFVMRHQPYRPISSTGLNLPERISTQGLTSTKVPVLPDATNG